MRVRQNPYRFWVYPSSKKPNRPVAGVTQGPRPHKAWLAQSAIERADACSPSPSTGACYATVGLVVLRELGVGHDQISQVLAGRRALATLVVLALAKLVAWWVALASGTSGGTLSPPVGRAGTAATWVSSRPWTRLTENPAARPVDAVGLPGRGGQGFPDLR